ncbi:MAG: MoaD/ThiS family protein [Elusimicrobia bacterium]|nr:MoaD/ThiS family protein [Elusimicrobiota bacterium]
MKRKIELYGRLRDAGLGSSVAVELPKAATARQAMSALKSAFGAKAPLLAGCALATGDEVLSPSDELPDGRLAVLPPVCGG